LQVAGCRSLNYLCKNADYFPILIGFAFINRALTGRVVGMETRDVCGGGCVLPPETALRLSRATPM